MRRVAIALTVATVLILGVEVGVRALGFVNFPIYAVASDISYVPLPNQSGAFLNRNSWVFNDRSMGVARPWDPKGHFNVLLIGNSIIYGGNPFDQPQKVGPLIQQTLGPNFAVWPAAAGGWTNVNQMAYLDRNPDVASAAQLFVWEFMAGGLSKATPWAGEYVWPQEKPIWAGWYVFRRYAVDMLLSGIKIELPSTGDPVPADMDRFAAAVHRLSVASGRPIPGILMLYPTADNLATAMRGQEWLPERPFLEALAHRNNLLVVDIAKDACWNSSLYRYDQVHPTVAGNVVLADILSRAIKAAASASQAEPGALEEAHALHEQARCQAPVAAAAKPASLARQ